MDFKRSLNNVEYDSWNGLLGSINDIALTDNKADIVGWGLQKSRKFTTKSLYRFITDRGVYSRMASFIWKSRVPLKIKFFLWQMYNDKLQVTTNLVKKNWKGKKKCCICMHNETSDHVFFRCYLARFVWGVIKEVFHLKHTPRSLEKFIFTWLSGKGPVSGRLAIFFFSGLAWALWVNRNMMAISKKFPKAPSDVIYCAISLMQSWSIRLKEADQLRVQKALTSIKTWLREFKTSANLLSDVVEL